MCYRRVRLGPYIAKDTAIINWGRTLQKILQACPIRLTNENYCALLINTWSKSLCLRHTSQWGNTTQFCRVFLVFIDYHTLDRFIMCLKCTTVFVIVYSAIYYSGLQKTKHKSSTLFAFVMADSSNIMHDDVIKWKHFLHIGWSDGWSAWNWCGGRVQIFNVILLRRIVWIITGFMSSNFVTKKDKKATDFEPNVFHVDVCLSFTLSTHCSAPRRDRGWCISAIY